MIAAMFWSVALGVLGVAFAAATIGVAVAAMVDDDRGPKWFAALALVVLCALCAGGSVALGAVAWL